MCNDSSSGTYKDESNNLYTPGSAGSSGGTAVTAITRGAPGIASARVHIVYRFWRTAGKTDLLGFTINNHPDPRIGAPVEITNYSNGTAASGANLTVKAYDAANTYYWTLYNTAYMIGNTEFYSDVSVNEFRSQGTALAQASSGENYRTYTYTVPGTNPVYLYVDYVQAPTTTPVASFGSANVAEVTYTGAQPIPNVTPGFNATIYKSGNPSVIWTEDYDFAGTDAPDLLDVQYSYVNTVNASDSGTGLPVNSGVYRVTCVLEDDTNIARLDSVQSKNRHGLTTEFTLRINKANALRGGLQETATLTYGETLGNKIVLSGINAAGVHGDLPEGIFSFTNGAADAGVYKNVGSNTPVSITWRPTGSGTINYKETVFYVNYTVNPAPLSVTPNAAEVVYGNSAFTTAYSATVSGLVANDANEGNTSAILSALLYTINTTGGNYAAYTPGSTGVGSYYIRTGFLEVPAVLSNYAVTHNYGGTNAKLLVTARPLTVTATATGRAYAPDDFAANVTFTIDDGVFDGDIVLLPAFNGTLVDNTVGIRPVGGIDRNTTTAALQGGDAVNYAVGILRYTSGTTLTVEITKAVPVVAIPNVTGTRYYTAAGRLSDINLNDYTTPAIAGTWSWADGSTNPAVRVTQYPAVFTPSDTANYNTLTVDVPLTITPSDVTISYAATVTYGDPRPDITQYAYNCVTDTAFSIAAVATSGNIYPSTEYDQYDDVLESGYVVTLTNANYRDVDGNYNLLVVDGLITVLPKTITVTADNAVITYGEAFNTLFGRTVSYSNDFVGTDTPNDLTIDASEPDFIFWSDYDYNENYNAGTYTIYVTMDEAEISPNYSITFVSGSLRVEKAALTVAGNTVYVDYGEAVDLSAAYTLTGLTHGETQLAQAITGTPTAVTTYLHGSPVTETGYSYYFDFSGVSSVNYRLTTTPGVVIVRKVNPIITAYPTASVPYGTALSGATFSAFTASVDGFFRFDAADATPPYSATPYNTGVIVYAATFVPADTVNYNTLSGLRVELTIEQCAISGNLLLSGYPMVGQTLTADLSAMNPATAGTYAFQWYVNGTAVPGATGSAYTIAADDENATVTLVATATGAYTGTAQVSVNASRSLTIAALTDTGIFSITGLSDKVYNGAQQGVTVENINPANALLGAITVKYNGSETIPTNAGTYGVTVDIALPDGFSGMNVTESNGITYVGSQVIYAPVVNASIGTFTIAPAPFNVSVTVADKVYDASAYATAASTEITTGAVSVGGIADAVAFDTASVFYLFEDANAGTGKAITYGGAALTGASAANYTLTLTITNANAGVISPRTLYAAIAGVDREYAAGNTAVELRFLPDMASYAPGDTDADVSFDAVAAVGTIASDSAGTQSVNVNTGSIVLVGDKAANYVWSITNLNAVTVVIEKATPDYPMPAVGILTYNSGMTLDDVSLGDSRWSWQTGTVTPGAGTHTFTAVFMPDDTINYKMVTKDVTVVVNKATLLITATSFTLTYGDTEPTYGYNVTGLTGTDTLSSVATGYALVNCAYTQGSPVRADGYAVTVTGYFTSANYSFRYVQGLVTVNPREVYTNATAASRLFIPSNYDVSIAFSPLTNVYVGDAGNLALNSYAVTGTLANNAAGTRAVTYTAPALTGGAAANYVLVVNPADLTVEITKAQALNVTMPTTASVVYGSPLSTAVFTSSKEGDGIFRLENPNAYPTAHGVFANVYRVEFIPTDSANYATQTAYITLTVNKKPLAVSASIVGTQTEGETLYVVTSAISNEVTPFIVYEWYRLNGAGDNLVQGVKVAEGGSYILSENDIGYYIACAITVQNTAPYTCETVVVTDNPIQEIFKTFWQKLWEWFYRFLSKITQAFGSITSGNLF